MAEHSVYFMEEIGGLLTDKLEAMLRRAVETALREEGVDVACEVGITLTDDAGIQEVNREFRNLDKPTDVLSFPLQELEAGAFDPEMGEYDLDSGCLPLGDVVLSVERAAAQAEEFGHSVERELSYLTVHSILHLLGYDHVDEGEQKKQMRAREEHILPLLGLARD